MNRNSDNGLAVLIGLGVVLVFCLVIGSFVVSAVSASHTSTMTCTVADKDRVSKPNGGGSDMRIYTSDCDVLVVADSLLDARFDAASLYNKITAGKRYRFDVRGDRIPILSMFPNIITATEVA